MASAAATARRVVAAARHEDRAVLETEALEVAAALGLAVPRHEVVMAAPPGGLFPGGRVVVKALVPGLAHKTERGAVQVVTNDPAAIADAIAALKRGVPECRRFLLAEYVPHEGMLGELLLGVRWTDAFGPVVTLGLGGVHTELLASVADGPIWLCGDSDVDAVLALSPLGRLLTQGFRGRPGTFAPAELAELARRCLEFAAAVMPDDVAEFEVNPLVATPAGPTALDAVLGAGPAESVVAAPPRPLARLDRLLRPRSIALVGVSSRMNPGRQILRNVLRAGFPAERVTVVKPGPATIDGCRCVAGLSDLAEPADLLVLAVAAPHVPELVEEATARGCAESIVVIPGGIGERAGSEARAARVAKAVHAARPGGPLVNGGNCLGVRSVPGRYDTFFVPDHKALAATPGTPAPVAVVAQSGAFLLSRLDRLGWLRPSYTVSVGNQVDLTVGDYATHFAADPLVEVVACYVEGLRPDDGRRLLAAARRLRARDRALVLYLAGRTRAGADASASHTAALATDHRLARALSTDFGALVADTLDEFTDLLALALLLRNKTVAGLRLGAVSNAGFETVAVADRLGPFGLARFGPGTVERLGRTLDAGGAGDVVAVRNPLDVTPMLGDAGFAAAAGAVLDDDAVDVAVVGCVPYTGALDTLAPGVGHGEDLTREDAVAGRLAELFDRSAKAWVAVVDGGRRYDAMAGELADRGVPIFRSADRAVAAFGRYCTWRCRSGALSSAAPLPNVRE